MADQFDAPDTTGALVTDVVQESPAEAATFKRGDIIQKYDGRVVENSTKLRTYVAKTSPKTNVTIRIRRDGKSRTLTVKIGQLPNDVAALGSGGTTGENHALSGLTVESVTTGEAKGVKVTSVAPNSRAANAGIQKSDVILEVNRQEVEDVGGFANITSQLKEKDSVLVLLRRGRSTIFLSIGGR